jgi:hypothetical protein
MRWLPRWFMLVRAVSKRHENGRQATVEKTVKDEAVVGLQPETVGGHASTRVGPISAIAAALHYLVHPRTRKKTTADASAETERGRRPEHGPGAARSPMEAGITGGFSLLMDNPGARKRR